MLFRSDQDSQARISELGQRLNLALAQRVQELSRYRSDFFGRLRTILGNRSDVRVVGEAGCLVDAAEPVTSSLAFIASLADACCDRGDQRHLHRHAGDNLR